MSKRRLVAVVDDDVSLLRGIERLLGALGLDSETYLSAEAFLSRASAREPNCLLLDIYMTGASGIELRERLAASGSTVPVIFMTAHDDDASHAAAVRVGCAAFLQKPFLARSLIDAIERATQ